MIFQHTVLIVAGVILVIALLFIAFSLYFLRSKQKYPPVVGECPDYWELNDVGGVPTCKNTHNLGTCGKSASFAGPQFVGGDANCKKAQWARGCNLTWDGITNIPDICSSGR
jgi:hypothetical protein